jgi:Xaa-Pro aminopeptidase
VVVNASPVSGGERPMLTFETLTLAPIDRRLIETVLLNPEEIEQLDAYHARVLEVIGPLVPPDTAAWLADVSRPLIDPTED